MLKNWLFRARNTKVRGSFSILKYFQTVNFLLQNFPDKHMSTVYFSAGPQNSRSLKNQANDECGFMTDLLFTAKNLTKGQFAQNLKNGSAMNLSKNSSKKYEKNTIFAIFGPNLYFSVSK